MFCTLNLLNILNLGRFKTLSWILLSTSLRVVTLQTDVPGDARRGGHGLKLRDVFTRDEVDFAVTKLCALEIPW